MEEITVKNIDHLGILTGLIDEIGIVEIINQKLGVDNREKITAATIISRLLYSNSRISPRGVVNSHVDPKKTILAIAP